MPKGVYTRSLQQLKQNLLNLSKGWVKGCKRKIMSEEHKNKIRLARLGKPHPYKKRYFPWTQAQREGYNRRKILGKSLGGRKPSIIKKPYISSNGKEYSIEWRELRKKVYKRDYWTCQECRVKCRDRQRSKGNMISCHHIDYNVNNNNLSNLITLCVRCHAKTNFNRQNWTSYFNNRFFIITPLREEKSNITPIIIGREEKCQNQK